MSISKHPTISVLAGIILTGLASTAYAATWDLGAATSTCSPNSVSCAKVSGITVNAWSNSANTGTASDYSSTLTHASGTTATAGQPLLYKYGSSGFGISDAPGEDTSPYHGIDNTLGRYGAESLVLDFNQTIELQSITLGWYQTDSDVSIYAWEGAGAPTYTTYGGAGWTWVGNYADIGQNGYTRTVNKSGANTGGKIDSLNVQRGAQGSTLSTVSSQYWMIAAYSGVGTTSYSGTNLGTGNDYFKLASVAGIITNSAQSVPEPATLLLLGSGLLLIRKRVIWKLPHH